MTDWLNIGNAIERGGIILTLVLALGGIWWLYYQERKKNDTLIVGLTASNKEMITALLDVHHAVEGFKEALNALKTVIETTDRRRK